MAKFSEVMMQWRRMCAAFKNCTECPQYPEYQCFNTIKYIFECGNIESLERNVMQWAAEHPEPVYPTWGEWLLSLHVVGVHAMRAPEPNFYYPIDGKFNAPIPADIAEKLGIEPKEG